MSQVGCANGYYWHERYPRDACADTLALGPDKYLEYPANLIRIVQRFLLGVDLRLDSSLVLSPTVPEEFYKQGFGQTLSWRSLNMHYRMAQDRIEGTYTARTAQRLGLRLPPRCAWGVFSLPLTAYPH